jgi:hypothetical protein|nr:MAG TPA: hypothetical protein [Caudoviricetes sp.]
MTTEEKIKLYEELHPEGKEFPKTKKPDEKPEDMQWLDEKIAEFQKLKEGKDNQAPTPDSTATKVTVKTEKEVPVYTVNQVKCLPAKEFQEIQKLVSEGKVKVIN